MSIHLSLLFEPKDKCEKRVIAIDHGEHVVPLATFNNSMFQDIEPEYKLGGDIPTIDRPNDVHDIIRSHVDTHDLYHDFSNSSRYNLFRISK